MKNHTMPDLPCPVCGTLCRADVVLRHKQAISDNAQGPREVQEAWQARPPHSDWRLIAPEHVEDYRAKDWEVRPMPAPAQPAVKLPKTNEIRKLIEDFTAPDWDTKTAFASHRRAWIVQCLELALAASALPSTGLPAPAPHAEVREGLTERLVTGAWDDARAQAIEECAQICEGGEWTRYAVDHSPTKACAVAIRALASDRGGK